MPWHCKVCGKLIKKRNATKEDVLSAIRRHYKKHHPKKFRGFYKKAARTRRKKK